MNIQTEIITIGDEILIGQIVDTNSAWMATELNKHGFSVKQITSVHDDADHIMQALDDGLKRAQVVLITGGLGPTKDDITKQTLCRYFHTELIHDASVHQHIHELYAARPDVLNRLTESQSLVPAGCTVIQNDVGSAPVMWFEHEGHVVVSMPGVPYEMKHAMEHYVIKRLQQHFQTPHIEHRTTIVYGIPESELALQIESWESALPAYLHLAYLPSNGLVRLRLSGTHDDAQLLRQQMDTQVKTLVSLLADHVIATEDIPLEVLAGRLLSEHGLTVGTAESCTGGTLAMLLSRHAGSSRFYRGSVVSYANEVKQQVLGVKAGDLEQYGAVSQAVVEQMAQGACRVLDTDYALSTSGIAGPDGGTEEKPVGTVWIAVSSRRTGHTVSRCMHFGTLREQNIQRAAQAALVMLIRMLRSEC